MREAAAASRPAPSAAAQSAQSAQGTATGVAAHASRRARLLAQLPPGAVAVLATAPQALRNGDSHYPYRYDSYFYYLSGYTEPDSVLVLVAAHGDAPARSILFCRPKDVERETWEGFHYGPEAARSAFGFDAAYPIGELDAQMAQLLADAPVLYGALARDSAFDAQLRRWMDAARNTRRPGVCAPAAMVDLLPLLDAMRLIKDDSEQATMRRAAAISAEAHVRAMRAAAAHHRNAGAARSHAGPSGALHAGAGRHEDALHEYMLEAELLSTFRRHGAQAPAYNSIVAAGANACVLHYEANNARIRDGDLVLIDAGCELDGYAADITRTWPANGRFSAPQRQLYELVLAAQAAALAAVAPGRPYAAIHDAAVAVLAQGMLDLGLLDRERCGSAADVIADQRHLQFYMHGTGHWLGLDVHDVGHYRDVHAAGKPSRALQAGMVLTVEPGIYVRPADGVPAHYWNTGIRIEDDVLVTATGHAVLSADAPKTVADIEKLMQ